MVNNMSSRFTLIFVSNNDFMQITILKFLSGRIFKTKFFFITQCNK